MYSNTVYLQYSNLKDYQWVRCTHNTLAQGSSKDCTTFGLERFRALSDATDVGMAACSSFGCHDAADAVHTTIDASINAPSIASDAGESARVRAK